MHLHRARLISGVFAAAALAHSPITARGVQAPDCQRNAGAPRWFVQAGAATEAAAGTQARPFASLADAERCSREKDTIVVLAAAPTVPPLDGGIKLKNGQKLLGSERLSRDADAARPSARITNTTGTGDAITLANDNEVGNLHIVGPAGAAIFADNVTGATIHDLRISRDRPAVLTPLDPALCRVVKTGQAVDNEASTLRGCGGRQAPSEKHLIMFLADGRNGPATVHHAIRSVEIVDAPQAERPDLLWPVAISINTAGRVNATLAVEGVSIENVMRGIWARGYDRSTITLTVANTRVANLMSDGIVLITGFMCSGVEPAAAADTPCASVAPAPLSDATVVLNADGYRFQDALQRGRPTDPGGIEAAAYDQGRSNVEIHAQNSDIVGAVAFGVFTYYRSGSPARSTIDLGCVNPKPGDPVTLGEDRAACLAMGLTSTRRNRIYANNAKTRTSNPHVEVSLEGRGRMFAQGNYWGDVQPADGQGDALGECAVFERSSRANAEPSVVKAVGDARCELYTVPGQGTPEFIDSRFHLRADPRPPRRK